jgi:PKD repeat protein
MQKVLPWLLLTFLVLSKNSFSQTPSPCGIATDDPPGCLLCTSIYVGSTDGYSPTGIPFPWNCVTVENDFWVAFIAETTNISITITALGYNNPPGGGIEGIDYSILDANMNPIAGCGNFTGINSVSINPMGIMVGELYSIRVDGWDGAIADVSIAITGNKKNLDRPARTIVADPPPPYCPGQIVTYSITNVPGSIGTTWTVPSGFDILSGQDSDEITVRLGGSGSGVVCATPYNECSSVAPYCIPVIVDPIPNIFFPPIDVCQGDFPFSFNGETFPGPGVHSRLRTTGMCDTNFVYTINQIIIPPTVELPQTVCPDTFPFSINGTIIDGPGNHNILYESYQGCDSVVQQLFISYPQSKLTFDTAICAGFCFNYHGQDYCNSGNYTITIPDADPLGCDSIIELKITYLQPFAFIQSAPEIDCTPGATLVLDGSASASGPNTTYQWRTDNGNFTGPTNNTTATIDAPGIYYLDVVQQVNGITCVDTDTMLINSSGVLPQRPDFEITENLVCEGMTKNYMVPLAQNTDDYRWTVTPASPFVSNQNSISVDWSTTGPATICVSSQNECGNSLDTCLNVLVQALPQPDFQLQDSLCLSDTAHLVYNGNASPSAAYQWSFNGANSSGMNQGPFLLSWTSPGLKTISLSIEENGCQGPDSMKNIFIQKPLDQPNLSCIPTNNDILFQWDSIPGSNEFAIFINGDTIGTQGDTSFLVGNLTPNDTIILVVNALGNNLCGFSTDTLLCKAQDCPPVNILIDPVQVICLDDVNPPVPLTFSGGNGGTVSWNGPGTSSNGFFDPNNANLGNNQVQLTYEENGCIYSRTTNIEVFETPESNFNLPTGICLSDSATILYNGNASSNAIFSWDFDNGNIQNNGSGAGPYLITWTDSDTFEVSLFVEENTCISDTFINTIIVDAPLGDPLFECNPSTNAINFSWQNIPNATDYEINVLTGPVGILNGNNYEISGLNQFDTLLVELVIDGNSACGIRKDTLQCTTSDCPNVQVSIDPVDPICLDPSSNPINLSANIQGGTGTGNENWSGTGISNNNILDPFDPDLNIGGNNTVYYTYEEDNCLFKDSLEIAIFQKPSGDFSIESPVCQDSLATLEYTGNQIQGANYYWNLNGGTPSSISGPGPHEINWSFGVSHQVELVVENQVCTSDTTEKTVFIDRAIESPLFNCQTTSREIVFTWHPIIGGTTFSVNLLQGQVGIFDGTNIYTVNNLQPGDSVTLEVISDPNNSCSIITDTIKCYADDCFPPISDFDYQLNAATAAFDNQSQNAISYLWEFGDGTTSSDEHPNHTFTGNGQYPVTLTSYNDCDTVSTILIITINGTLPTAEFGSSVRRFCAPDTIQFTDQSQGNPTFWEWSFPGGNPSSSNLQNPEVIYSNPGAFPVSLKVTNPYGENNVVQTAYIIAEEIPQPDFLFTTLDLFVEFINQSNGGFAYNWNFGDSNFSFEENPTHTYSEPGTYNVILAITNSCGTVTKTKTVTVKTSSLNSISQNLHLKIYPNPNMGTFQLDILSKIEMDLELEVVNVLGQSIFKKEISLPAGKSNNPIEIEHPIDGYYFLKVRNEDGLIEIPFIIKAN